MKKLHTLALASAIVGGAFIGGLALGKGAADAKFITNDEVKFDDMGGLKLGVLTGDAKKGPYAGILKLPAGFTSPLHTHTGDYEAVMISGTTSHWFKGEDGTKAKKLTPGSYWKIPGGVPHISSCAAGAECVFYIWQTKPFDAQMIDDKGKVIPPAKK
jgi:quercetin dioxygenase-like cupin family protein